jgi:hypothetical protein
VVAVYRNHHDDKPGHIAIIRQSEKSETAIREEGPQITQAGSANYRSTWPSDAVAGSYMSRQDKPGKGGSSM